MRLKLILTMSVLVVAAAICAVSLTIVYDAIDQMEDSATRVLALADQGNTQEAISELTQLASIWEKFRPALEMFTSHEDLHKVTESYVAASSNLRCGRMESFYEGMSTLFESLKHIAGQEEFSLSNIF